MAPPKGQPKAAKAASGNGRKQSHPQPTPAPAPPAASRPAIVPVIPLPLMQRQSRKNIGHTLKSPSHRPVSSSNRLPVSSLEAALVDQVPAQSAKASGNEVNGTAVEKPGPVSAASVNQDTPGAPDATTTTQAVQILQHDHSHTNGFSHHPYHHRLTPSEGSHQPAGAKFELDATVGSAASNDSTSGAHDAHSVHLSQPQSATATTFPNPPASYRPSNRPLQNQRPAEQRPDRRMNFPAPPSMHHHPQAQLHVSNGGGITFGGFDSHTPSPGPRHPAFMPPPVNGDTHMHTAANGHHHTHSNSNGFPGPLNTHFPPDMMPISTMDMYPPVQPAHVPPPFDAFHPNGVPNGNRYGPQTPHSFHGSHTSGEPNGMDNGMLHFPSNGHPYHGPPAHGRPLGPPPPAGPYPPFMHHEAFTRRPSIANEEAAESIYYLQNQFNNGELADCRLELASSARRGQPHSTITGHKLIFARSPALKHHILAARATDMGSHTIHIETEDAYIRPDAWGLAVRRLYMHPLLDHDFLNNKTSDDMDSISTTNEQFAFSLGYASAGHILGTADVLVRGLQMAAGCIYWNTIEESLAFVFAGTTPRHFNYGTEVDNIESSAVSLEFGYGPETKILMGAIIGFLIDQFPVNFELDTSVADPPKFARIPDFGSATLTKPIHEAPAIAQGTIKQGTAKQASRNKNKPDRPASAQNRLSSIQFGDLPAAYPDVEEEAAPRREPDKCLPVLSRVLLNLPFDELCQVLTSVSNGILGWNSAQGRYYAITDVVAEREARRSRAVEMVRLGSVHGSNEIQARLSSQRPHAIIEPWDVLNWKEQVVTPQGAEVPRIIRTWVPQFDTVSNS
ncbi:hypothetical protein F5Y15DRAFT_31238 [Xylariaceae sp. FL0016]|nr:hypothetical protein F5Y15DRAFT_31238 [Xylariaceae sp. FL0016]